MVPNYPAYVFQTGGLTLRSIIGRSTEVSRTSGGIMPVDTQQKFRWEIGKLYLKYSYASSLEKPS